MQRTHSRYAQRYKRLHGRGGHLWQNRFFSCALGRDHLVTALACVDLNPVRAHLAKEATKYEWSSARAHVEGLDRLGLMDTELWKQVCPRGDWRKVLGRTRDEEAAAMAELRRATASGRPLGGEKFVGQLESTLGRKLRPRATGRPKKAAAGA